MSSTDEYTFSWDAGTQTLDAKVNTAKFDAARVAEFNDKLEKAWSREVRKVRIFMNDVVFIDSSGIGALLGVQKRLANAAQPIELHTGQSKVISILELLRLQRVFHIVSPQA